MGSLEFLVHILYENHWVLLKFWYLDFGHLSLTPNKMVYSIAPSHALKLHLEILPAFQAASSLKTESNNLSWHVASGKSLIPQNGDMCSISVKVIAYHYEKDGLKPKLDLTKNNTLATLKQWNEVRPSKCPKFYKSRVQVKRIYTKKCKFCHNLNWQIAVISKIYTKIRNFNKITYKYLINTLLKL